MQLETRILLFGAILPGLLAGAGLLIAWRRARKRGVLARDDRDGPVWLMPILLLIGFIAADWVIHGHPRLWPDSAAYRYPHAVGLAAALGVVEGLLRLPRWLMLMLRSVVYAAIGWILVERYHEVGTVPTEQFVGWLLVGGIGGGMIATAADRAARDLPAGLGPALLLPIAGATAAIGYFGTLAYAAQSLPSTIAVLVAALVVGLLVRGLRLDRGAITTLVGIMIAMGFGAGLQAEVVSTPALLLLGMSPLGLLAAAWLGARHWAWRVIAGLIATGAILAASGAAMSLATTQESPDASTADPYADYDGPE